MFSTDATMVDLTAWSCQQQRNSFSLNTFHPWLVEAMMWSLWMLGGADSIVNLYFQMCCVFAFQMNDCTTCSEFWHFGAKKLTTQLPHKLSPGPGGYLIIVTRGRVAWYRLKRKGQCVKTGPVTFPPCTPMLHNSREYHSCCVVSGVLGVLPFQIMCLLQFPEPWLRGMWSRGASLYLIIPVMVDYGQLPPY